MPQPFLFGFGFVAIIADDFPDSHHAPRRHKRHNDKVAAPNFARKSITLPRRIRRYCARLCLEFFGEDDLSSLRGCRIWTCPQTREIYDRAFVLDGEVRAVTVVSADDPDGFFSVCHFVVSFQIFDGAFRQQRKKFFCRFAWIGFFAIDFVDSSLTIRQIKKRFDDRVFRAIAEQRPRKSRRQPFHRATMFRPFRIFELIIVIADNFADCDFSRAGKAKRQHHQIANLDLESELTTLARMTPIHLAIPLPPHRRQDFLLGLTICRTTISAKIALPLVSDYGKVMLQSEMLLVFGLVFAPRADEPNRPRRLIAGISLSSYSKARYFFSSRFGALSASRRKGSPNSREQ